jgi:hypothetical protein
MKELPRLKTDGRRQNLDRFQSKARPMAGFNPLQILVIHACMLRELLLSPSAGKSQSFEIYPKVFQCRHRMSLPGADDSGHRMKIRCIKTG